MKPSSKEIEAMEHNEYGFFSLWSEAIGLDSAKIFLNKNLPDDLLFNRASVSETKTNADRIVERAIAHFQKVGVKPTFFISQHNKKIEQKLLKIGFKRIDNFNVMRLEKFIPHHNNAAEVSAINAKELENWVSTYMESFGITTDFKSEVSRRAENSLKSKNCILYIAKVKGELAGTCLAFNQNNATGFYCVGTIPKFRGMGIASQMLTAGIEDSKTKLHCLQNLESDDVRVFYEKRGFKTFFVKKVYQKA